MKLGTKYTLDLFLELDVPDATDTNEVHRLAALQGNAVMERVRAVPGIDRVLGQDGYVLDAESYGQALAFCDSLGVTGQPTETTDNIEPTPGSFLLPAPPGLH